MSAAARLGAGDLATALELVRHDQPLRDRFDRLDSYRERCAFLLVAAHTARTLRVSHDKEDAV